MWIGLTGGIGSGKSTVARELAGHGAHIIDADALAREVVAPGSDGLAAIVERFGGDILTDAGDLDRARLGRLVFEDAAARADLEAITHPRILALTDERRRALSQDAIAVHDIPLLVEMGLAPRYHLVAVVDTADRTRLHRLAETRGMSSEEAESRIAAQASTEDRQAVADAWLTNNGAPQELSDQVARLWVRLRTLQANLRAGTGAATLDPVQPTGFAPIERRHRGDRVRARVEYLLRRKTAPLVVRVERADPMDQNPTIEILTDPRQSGGPERSGQSGGPERSGRSGQPGPSGPSEAQRAALTAGGFPPVDDTTQVSADPGRAATVRWR